MANALTVNWSRLESDYIDFCLDFFDEKPVSVFSMEDLSEKMKLFFSQGIKIPGFVDRLVVLILRCILVKRYVFTDIYSRSEKCCRDRGQNYVRSEVGTFIQKRLQLVMVEAWRKFNLVLNRPINIELSGFT